MDQASGFPPEKPQTLVDAGVGSELTLADVMRLIEADPAIEPLRKRHWLSSLRRVAAGISRPPASIVARLTSLRHPMKRLNAARMGIEEKSLANHRSNVRAAVLHVLEVTDAPRRGMPLLPEWKELLERAALKPKRLLSGLARFYSSRGLGPEAVTEDLVEVYFDYREETTFLATDTVARRELARSWNVSAQDVPSWPKITLTVPALGVSGAPARGHRGPSLPFGKAAPLGQRQAAQALQALDHRHPPPGIDGLCPQGLCCRCASQSARLSRGSSCPGHCGQGLRAVS